MKLTILTASIGPEEVLLQHYKWFKSLDSNNLKMIIIDQGKKSSSFLENKIVDKDFNYIYNEQKGLSLNRNIAMKSVETEYTMFLDDDARFTKEMLQKILKELQNKHDVLLCAISNADGSLSSYTKSNKSKLLNIRTIEGHVNSNGLIIKTQLLNSFKFDEKMGVGAKYGSGEDAEIVAQILDQKFSVYYEPSLRVVHPPKPFDASKAFSYGKGHGYFTKKMIFKKDVNAKILGIWKIIKAIIKYLISFAYFRDRNILQSWVKGFWIGLTGEK